MSKESVLENKGTLVFNSASTEILQEPDVREDQLKYLDLKYIETY